MEFKVTNFIYLLYVHIFIFSYLTTTQALPIGIPPNAQIIRLNNTLLQRFSWSADLPNDTVNQCRLRPVDKGIHSAVNNALEFSQLIEYTFEVAGYKVNPLSVNNTYNYKLEHWARTVSSHGQTILNLAFNYGILSLRTLSFGVNKMDVELVDEPAGCVGKLNEDEKMLVVLDIVMRDLKPHGRIKVYEGQSSICHQLIKEVDGMAKFTDQCCYESTDSETIECIADIPNKWLDVLHILLGSLTICVFIFGPMMIPGWFYIAALDNLQYYIKLKEPLYKTIAVCRRDKAQDIDYERVIDLRNGSRKDFKLCRRIIADLPEDKVIPIKISQFDIKVNYKKLLPENKVPVGLIKSLSRAVFLCKIRELGAFKGCCDASITGCVCSDREPEHKPPSWFTFCNLFGRILLVFFVPFPFYIRLAVYYLFENPEIMDRQEAAQKLGLVVSFNSRLLQFLTPTHPVYIIIYVIYFLSGFSIAYCSGVNKKTRLQQAITDAFNDLRDLSMLNAVEMFIRNCLWPFKEYGVFGMFIGVITWPLLMPVSIILCLIYCLPLVFVSFRIILYTFTTDSEDMEEERRDRFKPSPLEFEADQVLEKVNPKSAKKVWKTWGYCSPDVLRFFVNLTLSAMTIAALLSVMFIVAEVVTFAAEILSFTMMGIIVNASSVLKYITLIFLVVLYSYDCYSNVTKKYLKLNKAIFSEVKFRLIKDIEQYTQLPSEIQENRGFKAVEASGQAEYESIDNISATPSFHWDINDLILFIDKEDMPRIPKQLFEDVCEINVAGAPGPVYRSLIIATRKFMIIICFLGFVFIVVSSFSSSGKSTKNHTLIAMAGGFAPLMFRYVFKPGKAEVETGLLSFKSKLEEIIKNFTQSWPMHDFVFDIEEEPKPEEEQEEEKESETDDSDNENDPQDADSKLTLNVNLDAHNVKTITDINEKENNNIESKVSERENNLKDKRKKDGDEIHSSEIKDRNDFQKDKKDDKEVNKKNGKDKSKKNGKDTKDSKDKDKKDSKEKEGKDKDKKKVDKDWLAKIAKVKQIDSVKIQEKLDDLILEPAAGQKVDILIYVGESDKEWDYEVSLQEYSLADTENSPDDHLIKHNGFNLKEMSPNNILNA